MAKDKSQDIGIVSRDSINAAFNVFTSIGEEERPQIIGLSGLGLGLRERLASSRGEICECFAVPL